ncbi:3419_t:CDS:1, partial [Ambispora gerdemannii]
MRERNREKKFQHTISSETNSTTEIPQDTTSTVASDLKTIQSESKTSVESEQIIIDQVQDTISAGIAELKKIPYNQKVEQDLKRELSACIKNN